MGSSRLRVALPVALLVTLVVAAPARAADPTFAPFASYATGSGIGPGPAPITTVAADFTGDGKPDVATTTQFGQGSAVVMPNLGTGTFGAPLTVAGTSGSQSLAAGDVNGDGKRDLVGMTANNVVVALGNGSGGFTAAGSYPETIGAQIQAILSDLNNDGKLDIVAMTFASVQTLINNGNGTFHAGPTSQVTGASTLSAIAAARINGDANRDLYAVDGGSGTVFALRGTGTGAFTVSGQLYASAFIPEDVNAVDLNGDGFDDVGVIGSFSFTVATALSNGNGGFGAMTPVLQSGGAGPTSMGSADFNNDGKQDLVVSDVANPAAPSMLVFTGNGTVQPRQSGSFAVDQFPQNPAIADYNADGRKDIAVAGPDKLSVLLNTTP
jgi:hypothetical protein